LIRTSISLAVAITLAAPAPAQSVRAGIEAWQKGEHEAAVAAWTPLATRGDADAAFNLGQAYRLGKGVPLDLARAQQYFEAAARKGHVDAATTLGILMFQNGNRTGAMRWLKQAADAGDARAMLLYGTALFNGDGTARDSVKAYALVSRAAAQGLVAARETLLELDETLPLKERMDGVALAKTMAGAKAPDPTPKTVIKVAAKPVEALPAPVPAKPAPVKIAAKVPATGGWRIQLGAFGQRATAEALFARLRGKIGARQAYYIPAGKVVRLQVGPFESRAAAASACAALGGQACFPVAAR
jgi:cell division septation protein DedD